MAEYSSHKGEDNTETIEETMAEITETEGYQRKIGINHYTMRTTATRVNQNTMAQNQWINNHKNNTNPSPHTEEKKYQSHQPYHQLLINIKTEALHKDAHPSNPRTEGSTPLEQSIQTHKVHEMNR